MTTLRIVPAPHSLRMQRITKIDKMLGRLWQAEHR
jgi:hypothetical protein